MNEICLKVRLGEEEIKIVKGKSAYDVYNETRKGDNDVVVCKIDGVLSDMCTEIQNDCVLEFVRFDDAEGREVFWHSSAHVLGNALLNLYPGARLSHGPATEEGFFYDVHVSEAISSDDYKKIEDEMYRIIKRNARFEKSAKSRNELLEMYKDNPFKTHFLNKIEGGSTVYKSGEFVDMCLGPHVRSTGMIKAVKVLKNGSAYFLNDPNRESLQRVYGIAFPSKELLQEYLRKKQEAKERDHRRIGTELELFFFSKYSPGSCFFLPNGAIIYNTLIEFLRGEYRKRGFKEVITPNIFCTQLWEESGHFTNYKENMFIIEGNEFAMKPMNCPGHCVMFKHQDHSFRELPLRYADFGVLHRNELTGALTGLTRVRRFQQDDAHIFCTKEQVKDEIKGCIEFLRFVYRIFKFRFELGLSTRPTQYLGSINEWDDAEKALSDAMDECGIPFKINEGDGAFYGPKIDIILHDALGRAIQCATIQLDFQLPQRFGLEYRDSDGQQKTPVIIHRAILGSIERMIAIILESFGKRLPFWLSPRQIAIVSMGNAEYVNGVKVLLSRFRVDVIDDNNTLNKRIRTAETQGYAFVCVIGKKEAENQEINVRFGKENKNFDINAFKDILDQMADEKLEFEDILDITKATISN
ncbi:threonyl-tRNA synthetase [Ordospora colligata]|uniref:Probable threonine--tRNA ligase, cytoplasmic n=1 Tax=Ordospora colligata OC4 TaxID=1354746 RepID=A0A0B2UJK3_9MICR|nr:threonyl-tRNA synthetase [Ordospora colligata OC4]KHN69414.1 threonyl-tRNA synthetase [Ordospora colligata OC4]TBU14928.1 threonyl-tRNA synthetase [Ordospora colligata]TBU15059.1 threonyl-tRNA synthetase [Ordospora colligata]TBU18313.1 threonyl-tRNA synthetase [Ordospora colligata]